MAKPTILPRWATDDVVNPTSGQNNVDTPSAAQMDLGWDFKQKPPRQFFNYLARYTHDWCEYVDDTIDQPVKEASDVIFNDIRPTGNIFGTSGQYWQNNAAIIGSALQADSGNILAVAGDVKATLGDLILGVGNVRAGGEIGTDFTDYTSSSVITGITSIAFKTVKYRQIGKLIYLIFSFSGGTNNGAAVNFTLPFASANITPHLFHNIVPFLTVGVLEELGKSSIQPSSNVCDLYRVGSAWPGSGTLTIAGTILYQID